MLQSIQEYIKKGCCSFGTFFAKHGAYKPGFAPAASALGSGDADEALREKQQDRIRQRAGQAR